MLSSANGQGDWSFKPGNVGSSPTDSTKHGAYRGIRLKEVH